MKSVDIPQKLVQHLGLTKKNAGQLQTNHVQLEFPANLFPSVPKRSEVSTKNPKDPSRFKIILYLEVLFRIFMHLCSVYQSTSGSIHFIVHHAFVRTFHTWPPPHFLLPRHNAEVQSISHLASTTRCSPSHPSMFGEPLGPPHNLKHRMIIISLMEMKIYFGRKKTPAASHIVVDFSEQFGPSRRITG
jgi:hypothetical protein